jgi:hypothetical protein
MNNQQTTNMKNSKKPAGNVPLQTLDVPVLPAAPEADSSKAKFVHFKVDGTAVTEFSKQAKAEKDAKKAKDAAKALFDKEALLALFQHNVTNPTDPKTTVKVTDEGNGCVNVSFKNQYTDLPYTETLAILTKLGVRNVNKFVAEHLVVGFDPSVFYGEGGLLNTELYTEMVEAIQEVAARHSVTSPISSTKVLRVNQDFHAERWTIGNNELDQETLSLVVKNTTSFTPVVA